MKLIQQQIKDCSKKLSGQAVPAYTVISIGDTRKISAANKIPLNKVEATCLKMGTVPIRYIRNIGTIGIKGQLKLLNSTAAVIGAGGLGGLIIELLARAGFGCIIIIDNGKFVEHNLNRQLLSTEENLGKFKANQAASRVRQINSAVSVSVHREKFDDKNGNRLLKNANIAIDALDNLQARYALQKACNKLKIPLVHGAIAGFNGQVMTIMPGDKGLEAIYGRQFNKIRGIETITGNPPTTPAAIAAWQVQEAIKVLTGTGKPIRNRLLYFDFTEGSMFNMPFNTK